MKASHIVHISADLALEKESRSVESQKVFALKSELREEKERNETLLKSLKETKDTLSTEISKKQQDMIERGTILSYYRYQMYG